MTTYEGIVVYGGDIVSADDVNANTPKTYVKAATTSRNTTTTYANDDELVSIPLETGTYEIELMLFYTLSTTTTQKIKTQWAFTGTWNSPVRACIGPGNANTAAPNAITLVTMSGFAADTQDAIYDSSTSSSYSVAREIVYEAIITVAGNLSLQWAQSASSANNTNVRAGTAFRVRKISD